MKRTTWSLKWLLIATTLLGAGGGTLYRLLITDPNTFQGFVIIMMGPVAAAVLLATAIRSAWRRRGDWPTPVCRACGEALRLTAAGSAIDCPGCNAEPLRFDQVRFGEAPERDHRALKWIALAVALPLLGVLANSTLFPHGRTYAPVGSSSLIANHLVVDEPQIWWELDLRMSRGELTGEHVDAVLKKLASHFAARLKTNQTLYAPWANGFLADKATLELASDEALAELATAITQPSASAAAGHNTEDFPIDVAVYSPARGPFIAWPIEVCWELVGVTADGESLPCTPSPSRPCTFPGGQAFLLDREAEAVRVEVRVVAFRGQQKLDGFDSVPRSSRATDPNEKPLTSWTLSTEAKLKK